MVSKGSKKKRRANQEKRLITAALPYTNNVPHLGNLAGSHFPADVFARYCRLAGYDTVFVGATDEHGTATEITAQKYGITPKQLCDFFYNIHRSIYSWFEISYDNFSRTSRPVHHKLTQEFFLKIYKNGYFLEKELNLPFCKSCRRQLSDRFIEGTCPYCGYEGARGDQCEHCGKLLDPEDLKNPYCAICGSKNIVFKKTKHLFFDLEKLSPKLERWIKSAKVWRTQVKNMALSWIKEGLKPRCITRDLKWGVKVPIKGYEDKVFYVWFDAPLGYISSTKEWNVRKWKQFWQKKGTKIYNFIGKDNVPFHTIFFPAMLMANGDYNLPYNVVGLQYLNYERTKFSKSKGIGVFCENLPDAGLSPDYWRFYLSFIIPETKDTEFLWSDFKDRINNELVGNIGNFVNRTLSFVYKKFDLRIPKAKLKQKDKRFMAEINKQTKTIIKSFEAVELRAAIEGILKLSDMGNKYFQENEPWKDEESAKRVVFVCTNLCRVVGLLMQPFIPLSSKKLLKMLNVKDNGWSKLLQFTIKPGHKVVKPELLFQKIDDIQINELKKKTSKVTRYFENVKVKTGNNTAPKYNNPKEVKNMKPNVPKPNYVTLGDFNKIDLRVGKVIKAEPHPKNDRLFVLLVDLGEGEHDIQIVAGLGQYYNLADMVGKNIVVVRNLKPALIAGVESNGMLLAAVYKNEVTLLTVDKEIHPGAKIE